MKLWRLVAALALLGAVGCGVSSEAKKELQDNAAVSQQRLRAWDSLPAAQQKTAYFQAARGFADLDLSICGTPLPAGFGFERTKKETPK